MFFWKLCLLSILGGLLSWAAWPESPFFFLIFIAWVPLLLAEKSIAESDKKRKAWKVFGIAYLFFLVWNVACTWWLVNATVSGAIVAFVANAFLMTLAFIFFHWTKRKFGNKIGYASLIVHWLSFEYLHQIWELAYPWLNLGNVFAKYPAFIQWYSITGSFGGTLWVLLVNLLIFNEINRLSSEPPQISNIGEAIKFYFRIVWKPSVAFIVPLFISVLMFNLYEEKGDLMEVVVLQPNKDPYFRASLSADERRGLVDEYLENSAKMITDSTRYILWPESSVPYPSYIRMDLFDRNETIRKFYNLLAEHPQVSLLLGVTLVQVYEPAKGDSLTATARPFRNRAGKFYDSYNAAVQFDFQGEPQIYYKSKLVPGTERMPYFWLLGFLDNFKILLDEDPIAGSLGTQNDREVFVKNEHKVAPVICYESVFGEYVTEYIKNGANYIFIITNDAWWGETDGHRNHLRYGALRAIETRRSIARSANTGISCFIDQRGIIHQATAYNEDAVIRQSIRGNEELTFYTRYGDLLSRGSLPISLLLILNLIVSGLTNDFRMMGNKRK